MLVVITVTLVRGALAFKAKDFGLTTYYTPTTAGANTNPTCNLAVAASTTLRATLASMATTNSGTKCANIPITNRN